MAEEWRSTRDNRLLRASWYVPENLASKDNEWRKENLPVWFRLSRSDEVRQRHGGE